MDGSLSPNDELTLDPGRAAVVMSDVRDLLSDLRRLEEVETFELEPVTNAKRWWLDDTPE